MKTKVLWRFAVLWLCPTLAVASCGTHRIQYYDLLIRESRYSEALRLVLNDLNAGAAEKHAFKILAVPDDSGEEPLFISPSTLQAGKSAACQRAAAVLTRVRERKKDREQLNAYHRDWIASRNGWAGCEVTGKKLDQPEEAAATAYQCLEDPSLETHQAALEIRVLLAKAAAGDVRRLSDEDADLLQQQLNLFHEGSSIFDDKSTDSFYLPQLKGADRESFCRAVAYTRETLHVRNEETAGWQQSCRQPAVVNK
jgi:hypothetical protein